MKVDVINSIRLYITPEELRELANNLENRWKEDEYYSLAIFVGLNEVVFCKQKNYEEDK
mgnify:CR=1 FL=1